MAIQMTPYSCWNSDRIPAPRGPVVQSLDAQGDTLRRCRTGGAGPRGGVDQLTACRVDGQRVGPDVFEDVLHRVVVGGGKCPGESGRRGVADQGAVDGGAGERGGFPLDRPGNLAVDDLDAGRAVDRDTRLGA